MTFKVSEIVSRHDAEAMQVILKLVVAFLFWKSRRA